MTNISNSFYFFQLTYKNNVTSSLNAYLSLSMSSSMQSTANTNSNCNGNGNNKYFHFHFVYFSAKQHRVISQFLQLD